MKTPVFFIVALAVAASILAPSNASADTYGPYTYTVANGEATITDFSTSYSGALSITNELGGYPVITIGNSAFYSCKSLTSVTIPDSVTTIGDYAFSYCTALTSVAIGSDVTTIGRWAFDGCTALARVTIPTNVNTIGNSAFDQCNSLTNIIVVSTNPNYSSLDGVLFNNTQTTLIRCPGGKNGTYTIPASVTSIGDKAFIYCDALTSVTIPASVTYIGVWAFGDCTALASVNIGNSVTTIESWAFSYCTALTSVTIPSSVTSIGNYAFSCCDSLTSAYFTGNAPIPGINVFSSTSATVYYFPGTSRWGSTYADRPTAPWLALVAFDAQGGTTPSPSSISVILGYTYGTLAATSRPGFSLEGWWTGPEGTGARIVPTTTVSNTGYQTLYANWIPNTYLVTFDTQGGTAPSPASISVIFCYTYGTLAATSRPGFSLEGWWTGPGGTGSKIVPTTTVSITGHQTLYANWAPNTYLVTFDAQGESAPTPASKSVTFGGTYGTLASPSRTGYTFKGWWTGIGGSGTEVTSSSPVTITSAQTLYAKWESDAFNVLNGSASQPVGNSSAVNPSTENSGDGGTSVKLGGVGLLDDGEIAGIEVTVVGSSILEFYWKVSSEQGYDVLQFYEVGVGATNQISGTDQGWTHFSVEVTGDPETIHTFRWEYVKDPIGDYVGDDAGWVDAISWSSRFSLVVVSGTGDGQYTRGTVITISAEAPESHYEFDCWTGDTNGVADVFSAATTLTMPFTNVTVSATYKPIIYPLTVVNGSGSGAFAYDSHVNITALDLAGKQFCRWTGDVEFVASTASATTTVTMPDFPISIAATYTVSLTINGGSGSGWHLEGSVVTVAADADPLYMEFASWTGDAAAFLEDASSPTTTLTMPTTPSTLTATYRDSIARVSGSYGRTYTQSGTENGISTDAAAGSPSGNAAVKLGGTGVVPDNGFAAFETIVQGSGSITFWWKSSSEVNDYLRFLVDDVQVVAISGTKTLWTWVSNRIEGTGVEHALRWEYVKNGSMASTIDAAWVDDIVWIGDFPMPVVAPDMVSTSADDMDFKFSFWGERGIPYFVYTKDDLNAPVWLPVDATIQETGEENGVFRCEASVDMSPEQTNRFFRVSSSTPYSLSVDGGTGGGSYSAGTIVDIVANDPPVGYVFVGWTISPQDANLGAAFEQMNPSTTVTVPVLDVTLTANWTPVTYTVTYNGNGSTGGSTADSSHTYGVSETLMANGFTRTGSAFVGWATSADGAVAYGDGQSVMNLAATQGAVVTLYAKWSPIPPGMVLIPDGTNSGTNPDPDFGTYSLTVDSFFMDATEVTKAKWDEVNTWAIAHGYSFDNAGSGKAANHPVQTVNWYDAVKWCNARSEKEGRPVVYTVDGAVYKTGQRGNVVQTAAAGYRLPTEAEWEYAARGGLSGKRFPWGDEIQHAQANYWSWSEFSYDTSLTRGHHPDHDIDPQPYTSSVGSFAANGFGLFDMAGNVYEWCFDRYDDKYRMSRGGCYAHYAYHCQIGYRYHRELWPSQQYIFIGFRAVLPAQ